MTAKKRLVMEDILMKELSNEEIKTCAKLSGVDIPDDLLEQVAHNINGTIQALNSIEIHGLENVEPLPIVIKD